QRVDGGCRALLFRSCVSRGIRERGRMKPTRQRPDLILPLHVRQWQHTRGLAVESTRKSDDVAPSGVGAGQAYGGFDRLRAAAEKLNPPKVPRRQARDEPRQLCARPRREAADGDQIELLAERPDVPRMSVTEAGHRDARVQVEIAVAVQIDQS